jgi:hypothetical protein
MSVDQQRDILEHTFKQLTEFCGKPPVGSVAPWWEVSKEATEMLLEKGILYGMFFTSKLPLAVHPTGCVEII